MIERALTAAVNFLSRTAGFGVLVLIIAAGLIASWWFDASPAYNLALSIASALLTGAVLIAQAGDTAAIQTKLDTLILAAECDNDAVGLERRPLDEIEAERTRRESAA